MENLYRFVYTSGRTMECNEEEIEKILTSARRNNPALGLTGLLIHTNNRFLQILEGEKSKIESLYAKILEDNRHVRATQRFMEPVTERLFGDWSMGYKNMDSFKSYGDVTGSDKNLIDDLREGKFEKLDPEDIRIIKAFMKVG